MSILDLLSESRLWNLFVCMALMSPEIFSLELLFTGIYCIGTAFFFWRISFGFSDVVGSSQGSLTVVFIG